MEIFIISNLPGLTVNPLILLVTHLDPIVNRNLVSRAIIQTEVPFLRRVLLIRFVPDYLHMNVDPLRRSSHESVTAQSIGRIPALQRLDILPRPLAASVHELAFLIVPQRVRLFRFLKRQLEAVVHHGPVLLREELNHDVPPPRKYPWHLALPAKLGDLQHLPVHVFQQCQIIAHATGAPQLLRSSPLLSVSILGNLIFRGMRKSV